MSPQEERGEPCGTGHDDLGRDRANSLRDSLAKGRRAPTSSPTSNKQEDHADVREELHLVAVRAT